MLKGLTAAAITLFVWGVTFACTRALLEQFSALEINALRFALAWLTLRGCELVANRESRTANRESRTANPAPRTSEWLFAAMGLTGVVAYQILENCAIYYTNASNVAILVSFGPVVTAVIARYCLRDHSLSGRFLVGSAISIVGVACVSLNGVVNFGVRPLGDLMALAAMVCWGFYSVLIGRSVSLDVPQLTVMRKAFGWALVLMLPFVFWGMTESGYYALDGSFSVTLDAAANCERFAGWKNWMNLGFLGVMASAACFVLWNVACRSLGVVRVSIGLYLTPIVGVLFAAVFLGERMTSMSIAGGVLILFGVVIATVRSRWRK